MPFTCSICGEESTRICARCTKDACDNHICEKCLRCSDCCECEVRLAEPLRMMVHPPTRVAPSDPGSRAASPHSWSRSRSGSRADSGNPRARGDCDPPALAPSIPIPTRSFRSLIPILSRRSWCPIPSRSPTPNPMCSRAARRNLCLHKSRGGKLFACPPSLLVSSKLRSGRARRPFLPHCVRA